MALQDYLDLITSQYRNKPKYIAFVTAFLNVLQDVQNVIDQINIAFLIDNAVGVQLDTIGVVLGQSRIVTLSGVDEVLSDTNYRLLLKAKIFKNHWKGKTSEIYDYWNETFPGNPLIVVDNQDMTMDIITAGFSAGTQQNLVTNGYIIPKPQAVGVNFYNAVTPIFAYGLQNSTFDGYGVGNWIQKQT